MSKDRKYYLIARFITSKPVSKDITEIAITNALKESNHDLKEIQLLDVGELQD